MEKLVRANKGVDIGANCLCPVCKTNFIKSQYSQVFCCSHCRVTYYNRKQKGKRNAYHREYNKKHPHRILRIMPTLTARDREERDAMEHYLTDSDFKRYVDNDNDYNDGFGCHVDLSTHMTNFYGID